MASERDVLRVIPTDVGQVQGRGYSALKALKYRKLRHKYKLNMHRNKISSPISIYYLCY